MNRLTLKQRYDLLEIYFQNIDDWLEIANDIQNLLPGRCKFIVNFFILLHIITVMKFTSKFLQYGLLRIKQILHVSLVLYFSK